MEGHGRSREVKEGQAWSFLINRLIFQVRKVMGGGCVACRIIVSALVPVPFLWTRIWDLDLGLRFRLGSGTGLVLDNNIIHHKYVSYIVSIRKKYCHFFLYVSRL